MRLEVPVGGLREAGGGEDDVDDVLAEGAGGVEADGGDEDGFLEVFGGGRVVVARHGAAEVMPVTDAAEPAEDLVAADVGADEADVGQVGPAEVGVVEDEHVAVRGVGELVDDGLGGERHDADEDGKAGAALDEGCAGGCLVDAVAGVVGFGDGGIEGGAEEGRVHLVGDGFEASLEDGEGHGVHQAGTTRMSARLAARQRFLSREASGSFWRKASSR